ADLHLHALETLREDATHSIEHVVLLEREPAGVRGIERDPGRAGAADELPQRHVERSPVEVPQGDVNRGHRDAVGARTPKDLGPPEHLVPEAADMERDVLADPDPWAYGRQ